MSSKNDNTLWIATVASIITIMLIEFIIITIIIYKNEINKRIAIKNNPEMIVPKYLNMWSNATFISMLINLIIMISSTISTICLYTTQLLIFGFYLPRICLSFFQTARLQLCFSEKKIIPNSDIQNGHL